MLNTPKPKRAAAAAPPTFGESIVDQIAAMESALTLRKFSNLTGTHYKTVYEMATDGRLPCMRIGTSIRLDPVITANWLRERSSVCAEKKPRRSHRRTTMSAPPPQKALRASAEDSDEA